MLVGYLHGHCASISPSHSLAGMSSELENQRHHQIHMLRMWSIRSEIVCTNIVPLPKIIIEDYCRAGSTRYRTLMFWLVIEEK
jgi:hypothetical protein